MFFILLRGVQFRETMHIMAKTPMAKAKPVPKRLKAKNSCWKTRQMKKMERLRNTLSAEMSSLREVSWFFDFKITLEDNCLCFFYLGKQMLNERKPHFNFNDKFRFEGHFFVQNLDGNLCLSLTKWSSFFPLWATFLKFSLPNDFFYTWSIRGSVNSFHVEFYTWYLLSMRCK